MTKKILFAGLLVSMIAAPAVAQFKGEKAGKVVAEGGSNGIFMDKRKPADREPCAKQSASGNDQRNADGDSFYEAWPSKWAKGEKLPEAGTECGDGVVHEGGGSGI